MWSVWNNGLSWGEGSVVGTPPGENWHKLCLFVVMDFLVVMDMLLLNKTYAWWSSMFLPL